MWRQGLQYFGTMFIKELKKCKFEKFQSMTIFLAGKKLVPTMMHASLKCDKSRDKIPEEITRRNLREISKKNDAVV